MFYINFLCSFSFIKKNRVAIFLLFLIVLSLITLLLILVDKLNYRDFYRITSLYYLFNNFIILFFGDGFNGFIVEFVGRKGQHVAFLALINKAGLLGTVFYMLFMIPIFVGFFKFHNNFKKYYLLLPILSWFLYGLFHNNLNNSLIWMILGFYYRNVYLFYDKK